MSAMHNVPLTAMIAMDYSILESRLWPLLRKMLSKSAERASPSMQLTASSGDTRIEYTTPCQVSAPIASNAWVVSLGMSHLVPPQIAPSTRSVWDETLCMETLDVPARDRRDGENRKAVELEVIQDDRLLVALSALADAYKNAGLSAERFSRVMIGDPSALNERGNDD